MVRDTSISSKILTAVVHIILFFVLIATLFPILHIIAISFSHANEVRQRNVILLPRRATILAYTTILTDKYIPRSFLNSVLITAIGTSINLLVTGLLAYPLSKNDLPFRRTVMIFIAITMFFGGGLIPIYLLVLSLGMHNTWWALILPGAVGTFNLIILISFFKSVSPELEDAARIDGANYLYVFIRIVVPLSKAAIAAIALFYAVGHWMSWFGPYIYLTDKKKFPLQLTMMLTILQYRAAQSMADRGNNEALLQYYRDGPLNAESIQYATLVFGLLPMLIIYPFAQKYFVRGVMIGSLKA